MKTWYLTPKTPTDNGNDLTSEYGVIKTVTDIEALRVRIDAALQVIKGEVDDFSQGVDYFGIIFSNTPISMKVQEISRVISSIEGVKSLTFVDAVSNKRTQTLSFYFTINSVYGDFNYDTTFENIA